MSESVPQSPIPRIKLWLTLALVALVVILSIISGYQRSVIIRQGEVLGQMQAALANPTIVSLQARSGASHADADAVLSLQAISGLLALDISTVQIAEPGLGIDVEIRNNKNQVQQIDLVSDPEGRVLVLLATSQLEPGELIVIAVGPEQGASYRIELR